MGFRLSARTGAFSLIAAGVVLAGIGGTSSPAQAATTVGLGTAESYVVLGGQSVTNTGPSVLNADLGVSPGSSITGFPPGTLANGGTTHRTDAHALQAQVDLVTAYNSAAAQAPDATVSADLGGQTLVEGVYFSASTMALTGTLTLDGQGDPGAVWVFQVGSALTTATDSRVSLTNGARACNVFWQVGESATLGTSSDFVGTIMALASVTVTTNASVEGRALARNGSVTLDNNVFTDSRCGTAGEPSEPGTPTDPTEPGEPGTPTEPGTPGEPGTPTEPGTPGEPGTPTEPGTPGEPGTPTEPGTPGEPGTPTEPGTPGTPTEPGTPGTPTEPGTPVVPDVLLPPTVPVFDRTVTPRDSLAVTGSAGTSEWMLIPAVALLAASGILLTVSRARRRRS